MKIVELIKRLFWLVRYRVYSRDLYKALREGRGTKENPLTVDDLRPVMKAQARLRGNGPIL